MMISQENANLNIQKMGILVMLDTPPNLQLGIDNTIWTVGQKFKGVKLIPLGTHFIHYKLGFKNGFFCHFTKERRIHVRRWHTFMEDYLPVEEAEAEQYCHAARMNDLDVYLGAYPFEQFSIWQQVSNYIDQHVLSKLDPIIKPVHEEYDSQENSGNMHKKGKPVASGGKGGLEDESSEGSNNDPESEDDENDYEAARYKQQKENFNALKGNIYYTDVPVRCLRGKKGAELTNLNFDKTEILLDLIQKEYKNDETCLLGEVQYAFIRFLLGEHYESFEQWKKLLLTITSCDSLAERKPEILIKFIPVFYSQIQQLPNDFFIDPISSNNFIKYSLKNLFEICQDTSNAQLRKRCEKLKEMVNNKFIGSLEEEIDDEAPQVVDDFELIQF